MYCFAVLEAIHQYIVMIMAGFAGNPHMIACTVLALSTLVHDHRGIFTVVTLIYSGVISNEVVYALTLNSLIYASGKVQKHVH